VADFDFFSVAESESAGIAQSVQRIPTSWTEGGLNSGGGEVLRTRSDRPWEPPSLLDSGYWISVPVVKLPGA
jgi:hypothetical protein